MHDCSEIEPAKSQPEERSPGWLVAPFASFSRLRLRIHNRIRDDNRDTAHVVREHGDAGR